MVRPVLVAPKKTVNACAGDGLFEILSSAANHQRIPAGRRICSSPAWRRPHFNDVPYQACLVRLVEERFRLVFPDHETTIWENPHFFPPKRRRRSSHGVWAPSWTIRRARPCACSIGFLPGIAGHLPSGYYRTATACGGTTLIDVDLW